MNTVKVTPRGYKKPLLLRRSNRGDESRYHPVIILSVFDRHPITRDCVCTSIRYRNSRAKSDDCTSPDSQHRRLSAEDGISSFTRSSSVYLHCFHSALFVWCAYYPWKEADCQGFLLIFLNFIPLNVILLIWLNVFITYLPERLYFL